MRARHLPRSLLIPTTVFTTALVLGCGEQPAPSEPATTPQPSLRTEQNPNGPGARVFRFNELFFWIIVDFERGLTAVLGATPEEHIAACQSGLIPEEASWQDVVLPGGVIKRQVTGGEMGVTIWRAASGDICGELAAVPIFAGGTARVRYVDNDGEGSLTRGNAFGVRAHGTVTTLATGEELDLLAKFQAVLFQTASSGRAARKSD
jgi:hypothetical protein